MFFAASLIPQLSSATEELSDEFDSQRVGREFQAAAVAVVSEALFRVVGLSGTAAGGACPRAPVLWWPAIITGECLAAPRFGLLV